MILNLQTGRSCWDVVKHYDSDDLLSGSEDEKALGRARRLAAAELKKTGAMAAAPTNKSVNPLAAQTSSRASQPRPDSSGPQRGKSTGVASTTRPRSRSPNRREFF